MHTPSAIDRISSGDFRDRLALEALSKLSNYFVCQPDFSVLLNTLLLTINGQFAVTSAFVAVGELDDIPEGIGFVATGRFLEDPYLAQSFRSWQNARYPFTTPAASRIDDLFETCTSPDVISRFRQHGVQVLAPVMHDNRIIGTIGLGGKANGQQIHDTELALLSVMANTVAPLVINALYFQRVNALNERHLAVLNSVSQGVFVFDHQSRLQMVNSTGYRILEQLLAGQAQAADAIGQSIESLFPDLSSMDGPACMPALDQAGAGVSRHRIIVHREQRRLVFDARVTRAHHVHKTHTQTIVTLEDISSQLETEEWMTELQTNAERGRVASEVAHELNNFLGIFAGGIEIASMAIDRNDLSRATSVLHRVKGETERMAQFSASLMHKSSQTGRRETIQLNDLVTNIIAFVSLQRRMKHIRISKLLHPGLPPVTVDANEIGQVLINLMNNSADAIAAGSRQKGDIWIRTRNDGHTVRLSVADDGPGMPPNVRPRVFRDKLTTKDDGHGHGLITCRKIIEEHGGRIELEGTSELGTCITITLPTDRSDQPSAAVSTEERHTQA